MAVLGRKGELQCGEQGLLRKGSGGTKTLIFQVWAVFVNKVLLE
jgi:hypothetical protein